MRRLRRLRRVHLHRLLLVLAGRLRALDALQRNPASLGFLCGFVCLACGRRYGALVPGQSWRVARPRETSIAGCWLGYRLFPFVPSFGGQHFEDVLKTLWRHPDLSFSATLDNAAGWASFFLLLSPKFAKPSPGLLLLAPGTLLLEVLVLDKAFFL
ncbi:MAG: hypothetical protein ACREYC_01970 [Gammaproteobacteria bacterium]